MKRYIYLMFCLVSILSLFCSCKQNKHTLIVIYEDGTKEIITEIKKGSKISEPSFNLPNEVNDIKYVDESGNEFSFDTEITSDLTIYASFIYNQYTVNFYDYDDTLIKSYTLLYGSEVVFPNNPTRIGGEGYTYQFKDWTLTDTIATKNLDYKAQYTQVFEEYTVNFYDYDKKLIESYTLPYGSEVIFPENPTRIGGEGYTYQFKDWTIKQTIVTKDLNFTARYTKVYDEMTVTALNING